jgi:hypothetical protein
MCLNRLQNYKKMKKANKNMKKNHKNVIKKMLTLVVMPCQTRSEALSNKVEFDQGTTQLCHKCQRV